MYLSHNYEVILFMHSIVVLVGVNYNKACYYYYHYNYYHHFISTQQSLMIDDGLNAQVKYQFFSTSFHTRLSATLYW